MDMTFREKENILVRFKSLLILSAVTAIVAILFQAFFKVGINDSTNSMPHLFYLIKKDPIEVKRNDIIEFDYYNKYGNGERFYYENHSPFVKKVVGVPGDKIEFVGNEFYINDFASGIVKKTSTQGDPLVPNKSKILGEDEYFVYTENKDSFDSRYAYVGYVSREQIKGKVILKWHKKRLHNSKPKTSAAIS